MIDNARRGEIRDSILALEQLALDGSGVLGEHGIPGFELRRLSGEEVEVAVALNVVLSEIDDLFRDGAESGGLIDARQAVFDELFGRNLPAVVRPPWEEPDSR